MENYNCDELYKVIIETFNKSSKMDFLSFLNQYKYTPNFSLFSDYCLNDKNKRNDIYSFVLLPGIKLKEISETINAKLPFDYKKTTILSEDNKKVLKNLPYLAINIVIPKKYQRILKVKNYDEQTKANFSKNIIKTIDMIKTWITNNPERQDYYNQYILKYQILLQESKSNSFNINLYIKSFFTSTIAAYIIHEVEKYSGATKLGWGTDRDSMLSSNNGLLYDNFVIQYNGFSRNDKEWVYRENCNIYAFNPDQKGINWYDDSIRLPDFCAGALSTIDIENECDNYKNNLSENQITKAEDVLFCINSHCLNLLLKFTENKDNSKTYNVGRLIFQ